ncbi:glycosyltransferase involved in cell wall biosynthesis [Pseudoxanthomonas japonensis]|uniref:glycosyltransferase family A protein n=1 Tax=Pseudoxanthomonas japonensis TaxID=69284 RepID=UPI0028555B00|nr:glycosyltransferase family A protein [Pseudoxanthomonas japonensis]MDR7067977.1 glycosyltransferase involved in cell wall biosynthesis [Pseudoxanthomonas japonensis]
MNTGVATLIDHAFVVPAYGDSPYLGECLDSLHRQVLKGSRIVVSSSTPSPYQEEVARRFEAEYSVHGPNRGIGADWNAAVARGGRSWVTIAHQDDVYVPTFVARTMDAASQTPDASMIFTRYSELSEGGVRGRSAMMRVKDVLLELGFIGRDRIRSESAKLRVLRLGCPIGCPAVTLGPSAMPHAFREDLRLDVDWEAWIRLAKGSGAFHYLRQELMQHRIHGKSETSAGIRDGRRRTEDIEMFTMMWPKPIARLLARAYAISYEAA